MHSKNFRPASKRSVAFNRRVALGAIAVTAVAAAMPAAAQGQPFPTRPIKLIVPYPPGAATDNISRAFGQELSKLLGQPVVVENRAGGGSSVGIIAAKNLPADGYTLLVRAEGFYAAKITTPSLAYEFSDFEIVAPLAQSAYALVVAADRGWKRVEDLKGAGREIDFGSLDLGVGVYSMLAATLARDVGFRARPIPFKGGAEGLTALLGGQLDAYFTTIGTTLTVKDNPKVRVLATTGQTPSAFVPGVKTFGELGLPGMTFSSSYSLNLRADTPGPIKAQIARATQQALASEAMKAARRQLYLEAFAGSVDDYRREQARILAELQAVAGGGGKASR